MTYKENISKQINYGASLIGGSLLTKIIVEAIMDALGSSISPEMYLGSGFGIACMMIGRIRIQSGINAGPHMNYWKDIRFHVLMTPVILAVMLLSYNISIYAGWREPIVDLAVHIPTFLGALVGYIFLAPVFNYYMNKYQDAVVADIEG